MYQISDKGRGVRQMFDDISGRYDLLNRVLSLGIDRRWRRFAVSQLKIPKNGLVLDISILPPVPVMWRWRLPPRPIRR